MVQNRVLICALLFLVATCEMQSISNTVAVSSTTTSDVKDLEMTFDKLKFATTALRSMFKTVVSKFDKKGHLEALLQIVKGEKLPEAQQLVQTEPETKLEEHVEKTEKVEKVETEKQVATQVLAKGIAVSQLDLANRIFLSAALITLCAFAMIYIPHTKFETEKPLLGRFRNEVHNLFFLLSGGLWFEGFMLLIDYLFDTGHADLRNILPLGIKLWASALFTIRPMIMLGLGYNSDPAAAPAALKWSDFMGIFLFHMSNMVSLAFMFQNDYSGKVDDYFKKNSHIFGMLLYTIATALLLMSSSTYYGATIEKTRNTVFQILGSGLLVVGSAMFMVPS